MQVLDVEAPTEPEADPEEQFVHAVDPALLEYVPTKQDSQVELLVAAEVVLYFPATQAVQEFTPPVE